ncbi:MAG TPA: MiaB/RimO family radical SAM methylthiotransferase [Candidatus Dormibacteraeota bacterium]|jgi:threonylcarbamoyladenosine tRNA methylthiotransferase MtaB|nr:MiaB/RimO family radical SAM methylthiotransferase [Candidatus Dormibacteraeota bacterium]
MNVSIQTLGCKVNFAEMAELGDRLARAGFVVSDSDREADVVVINSCTVTAQADRKLRTMVHGLRRRHPQAHLILTGCHVDNPNPRLSAVPSVDVAFPNARKREIFDYVSANFAPGAEQGSTSFARSRFFLKVQDGCNHRCTYCIVWRTRGASHSDDGRHLIERAQQAVAEGYGEIVLTGVDLGAFGRERGEGLAPFVRRMLAAIAPARLRLSSINANDFVPELVELAASPRFCRHLHIPLQSGSDRVLKRMGRLYRRRDYLALAAALRRQSPDMALTADVIVGFPGETEDDFAETASVAADADLSGIHVFRYSARAGTAAPRLGLPVDDPVSRERSRRLQAQAESQRRAYEARFIDRDLEVVWDREFPHRMRGLSDNYITVYAPARGQQLGTLARVRPLTPTDDGLLCA